MEGFQLKNQTTVSVGDIIIDCYKVYTVYKISKTVNNKGVEEHLIYYKPYSEKNDVICSIPYDNFKEAGFRKLIGKDELLDLLKNLSDKTNTDIPFDKNTKTIKDVLYLNEPIKTVQLLKGLWQKIQLKDKSYLRSDQEIFDLAINHLVDEVALVFNDPEPAAREKVMTAINHN